MANSPEIQETLEKARGLALQRVGAREYSAAEMRRYLLRKKISEPVADQIVESLVAAQLIQDQRFSTAMIRDQALRGKGPRFIHLKLRQKGVKIEFREVEEVFRAVAPDSETATVKRILERRYPKLFSGELIDRFALRKETLRAVQGMMRRGFSQDTVNQCLRELAARTAEVDEV